MRAAALGVILWVPVLALAADVNMDYAAYVGAHELRAKLVGAGIVAFGQRLRVAATLRACNRDGLASAIEPPDLKIAAALGDELLALEKTDADARAVARTMNGQQRMEFVSSAMAAVSTYGYGYREAVDTLKGQSPFVCDVAIKLADELLKGPQRK